MPNPIVADKSKVPATKLPKTYLYDIPTIAGEEITLVGDMSSINEIITDSEKEPSDYYNLMGQKVSQGYRGFVIHNGSKILNR